MDVVSFRYKDEKKYNRLKFYCIERGITLNEFFSQIIDKKIEQIDGIKGGMERFFESGFVPKPEIDEKDVEDKIVPWLRILSPEELAKQRAIFHQSYVFTAALLDVDPKKRATAELPYSILWRRYSW